jgi:hypothetical protein
MFKDAKIATPQLDRPRRAVLLCYFWVDRPTAFFVDRHHLNQVKVFHWLTYPPPELQTWSPLILSDVIAGGFLGAIIAAYAVHFAKFPCLAKPCNFEISES